MPWWAWFLVGLGGVLLLILIHDLVQRKDAILRNFPIVGHLRRLMIVQGPKLRQYIVTRNDEERPFTRDQRSWVYALGGKGEQLLRLRHGQRPRAVSRLPDPEAERLSPPRAPRGRRGLRPQTLHPLREGRRRRAGAGEGIPTEEHLLRLRDELRLAERARGAGDQSRLRRGRVSPQHRRGRDRAPPRPGGRAHLPDRHGLLRLPRRRRELRHRSARGARVALPRARHRAEAQPGREARPGRGAPGVQDHQGDLDHSRHPDGEGLHQPGLAPGLP